MTDGTRIDHRSASSRLADHLRIHRNDLLEELQRTESAIAALDGLAESPVYEVDYSGGRKFIENRSDEAEGGKK